jgi:hypothetical protein
MSYYFGTYILSQVGRYAWRKWRILVRMIGFINTSVTISLNYNQYNAIADLHTFQFTVVQALGIFVFTSRLLATDLNTESVWSLLTNSCSITMEPRNSTRNSFGLSPPAYDWPVTVLNWTCFRIHFSYKHSAQTSRKTPSLFFKTSPRCIARSDTRKCVYRAVA